MAILPKPDLTLMIFPPRCGIREGRMALEQKKVPVRLILITLPRSCPVDLKNGIARPTATTLFMRISILPKREKALSTTLRTSLVFDTTAVITTSLLRRPESSSRTLRSLRQSYSR